MGEKQKKQIVSHQIKQQRKGYSKKEKWEAE